MGGNRPNGNNYVALDWCATLAGMVHRETKVRAECPKCGVTLDVDVLSLLIKLGPKASLVDRHPKCRVFNCDGRVTFTAANGEGTPFMPCISRDASLRGHG